MSPFSILASREEIRTSLRSSFRPIWTTSSPGISRGVRPRSSSPAYRSFKFTRTSWTSIAVRPRLWMSSIPSRSVRPLHESGIPDGPKRITNSPRTKKTTLDYYSDLPDISIFAPEPAIREPPVLPDRAIERLGESRTALPGRLLRAPKRLNRSGLLAGVRGPVFMAKTPKTNPHLLQVVRRLREVSRETNAPIWRDVAERPERTRTNWSGVNLSRLSRYAEKGEQIVVPGVVLGTGELTTPVTVAAFRTSIAAQKKIEAAGGRAITLVELATQNPKGSGVRIMG